MPKYYEALSYSEDTDFSGWKGQEDLSNEEAIELAIATLGIDTYYHHPEVVEQGFVMWIDISGLLVAICYKGSIEDYKDLWAPIVCR